ncbi:hypothetical protein CTAYLR_005301 [Chrysophaeum taylorii]|uniref:Uncharacterized protein n=1 Tax=Chrysophaeum taylorii TaxID=2483200 RepID=A0AAD7UJ71_9STRA|nr:hypothetical protein CTAYLR_005301 [Chrysophaeum taylorii]
MVQGSPVMRDGPENEVVTENGAMFVAASFTFCVSRRGACRPVTWRDAAATSQPAAGRGLPTRSGSEALARLYGELNELRSQRDHLEVRCTNLSSLLEVALELRNAGISVDDIKNELIQRQQTASPPEARRRRHTVTNSATDEAGTDEAPEEEVPRDRRKSCPDTGEEYALALAAARAVPDDDAFALGHSSLVAALPLREAGDFSPSSSNSQRTSSFVSRLPPPTRGASGTPRGRSPKPRGLMEWLLGLIVCSCGDDDVLLDSFGESTVQTPRTRRIISSRPVEFPNPLSSMMTRNGHTPAQVRTPSEETFRDSAAVPSAAPSGG